MKWYENKLNLNNGIIRISHQRCSVKKAVFKNFSKFRKTHVPVFNKSAGLQACWVTQVFSENSVKFVRIPYVQNISGWLNLHTLTVPKMSKCRKIQTRKNSVFGYFLRSA